MCLPLKFIQLFIRINCFCFIAYGALLIYGVLKTLSEDLGNEGNGVVFTFCIGLAIIIIGVSGLLSSYCPNFLIIFIYTCFIIFIGVLVAYITIALIILQDQFLNKKFDCISSELPSAAKTKEQILWAETQFCKQKCTCYIEKIEDWPPDYLVNNRITYTTNPFISNITSYQSCEKWIQIDGASSKYISQLEQKYKCSGWCKQHPVYLFSDVNRGQPEHKCYHFFEEEYSFYVKQSFISYLIVDILYLFNVAFAICQCFQANRTKKARIYPQILYELAQQ